MKNSMEIIDELMDTLNEKDSELFESNRAPYIITKAHHYLTVGPEEYRSKDAFKLPDVNWSTSELKQIESGCKQILLGSGFRKKHPIQHLSIKEFYLLFKLFHFKPIKQKTRGKDFPLSPELAMLAYRKYGGHPPRGFSGNLLDEITFEHLMDGSKVTYYNLVTKNNTAI
jgi:hypothetical protein